MVLCDSFVDVDADPGAHAAEDSISNLIASEAETALDDHACAPATTASEVGPPFVAALARTGGVAGEATPPDARSTSSTAALVEPGAINLESSRADINSESTRATYPAECAARGAGVGEIIDAGVSNGTDRCDILLKSLLAVCALARAQRKLLAASRASGTAALAQPPLRELPAAQQMVTEAAAAASSTLPCEVLRQLYELSEELPHEPWAPLAPRAASFHTSMPMQGVPPGRRPPICRNRDANGQRATPEVPVQAQDPPVALGVKGTGVGFSEHGLPPCRAVNASWDAQSVQPLPTERLRMPTPGTVGTSATSLSVGVPGVCWTPDLSGGIAPDHRGLASPPPQPQVFKSEVQLPPPTAPVATQAVPSAGATTRPAPAVFASTAPALVPPALMPATTLAVPGEELEQGIARFADEVRTGLDESNQVPLPPASRQWAETDAARFPWVPGLRRLLQERFGFHDFRGLQLPVINALRSGHDVFAVMPTGSGKSLCYQLPALQNPGTVVVVSPLLSLMHDQVQALQQRGIACARLGSDAAKADESHVFQDLENGQLQLLYVSPERIVSSTEHRARLTRILHERHAAGFVQFFVIDEAHCVSQWGLDFRKQYRQLSCLRKAFPAVPILALTASATDVVRKDVIRSLHMQRAVTFCDTFDRRNLFLEVRRKETDAQALGEVMALARSNVGGGPLCGIVYALSRKDTDRFAKQLVRLGIRAVAYHAGLSASVRREAYRAWMAGECQIVVATVAFGMGIDKRDVRFVCHVSMPSAVERYHQEVGRAGRDGGPCRCIVWHSQADVKRLKNMALKKHELSQIDQVNALFCDVTQCRHVAMIKHFGEAPTSLECNACDVCWRRRLGTARVVEQRDVTQEAQKLLQLAAALEHHTLTAARLREAAKGHRLDGSGRKAVRGLAEAASGHHCFGCLRGHSMELISQLISRLQELQVIVEQKASFARGRGRFSRFRQANLTLRLGPRAAQLQAGSLCVSIPVTVATKAGSAAAAAPGVALPASAAMHNPPQASTWLPRQKPVARPTIPVAAPPALASGKRGRGRPAAGTQPNTSPQAVKKRRRTTVASTPQSGGLRSTGSPDITIAEAGAAGNAARLATASAEKAAESSGDELVTVGGESFACHVVDARAHTSATAVSSLPGGAAKRLHHVPDVPGPSFGASTVPPHPTAAISPAATAAATTAPVGFAGGIVSPGSAAQEGTSNLAVAAATAGPHPPSRAAQRNNLRFATAAFAAAKS